MRRTAVINQIRGLLLERGITVRKGRRHIDAALPGILEDAGNQLSGALRMLLVQLKLELDHLQMRIDEVDATINKAAGENEAHRSSFKSSMFANDASRKSMRSQIASSADLIRCETVEVQPTFVVKRSSQRTRRDQTVAHNASLPLVIDARDRR